MNFVGNFLVVRVTLAALELQNMMIDRVQQKQTARVAIEVGPAAHPMGKVQRDSDMKGE